MTPYSPDRRTALVFSGTGVHGAYHAGVLRALQEAGVKLDVVAGQGMGAGAATLIQVIPFPELRALLVQDGVRAAAKLKSMRGPKTAALGPEAPV